MDRNESDTENDQIARTLAEAVQDIFYTPQELAARLAELKARSDSSPPLPTAAHRAQDLQAQEAGPGESSGSGILATTTGDSVPPPSPLGAAADARTSQLRVDTQRSLKHVLRAAREVFGELGYGAPMEDVARRARVGVGTVYRRFPSKDMLVQRIAGEETSRLTDQARSAFTQENEPGKALERFVRAAVASGAGRLVHPDAMSGLPSQEPAVAVLLQCMEELLGEARAANEVRADITVQDLLAVISCSVPSHPDPVVQAASSARLLDIVLAGLRSEPMPAQSASDQLAAALLSRIPIEQAKAVLAYRLGVDTAEAFTLMRSHARSQRRRLTDVASDIIQGSADIGSFARPERS
ncbi:ANTAR domain-containing protein [Streptomyces tauricus]|uniref:ANTAR domain-containing protein n=1 Tax=Streptomyces tauricus TaxID=68274 RepID=UPI003F4B3057